jgi:4-hydroxybenzoate polyprenyltransferase
LQSLRLAHPPSPFPVGPGETFASPVPLCVDLDGTLIYSDMLWESLAVLLRKSPWLIFMVPVWFLNGRAYLKRQIAARATVDVALLPYNEPFLEYLRAEKKRGRPMLLASASDRALVEKVAAHTGLFDEVLASDGRTNLRGAAKVAALEARFGRGGFDYAGNSHVDVPVWAGSKNIVVVDAPRALARQLRAGGRVTAEFPGPPARVKAVVQALRPHQWVKNLIVFIPVITSHNLHNWAILQSTLLAFAAFCLLASGVYVINDLFDLASDRQHDTKRFRPLASGRLYLPWALIGGPLLMVVPLVVALVLMPKFALVLLGYGVLALAYTFVLKEIVVLDVFVLAALYTLRLAAGHVATGIVFSAWLLGFSLFIFLSLAMMKRLQELQALRRRDQTAIKGRGYVVDDLEMVSSFGVASGYLSVLILALYVNSEQVKSLYHHPDLLLLICPLMMYWLSRVWLLTHRGRLHDDPVLFAIKDAQSYAVGALALLLVWLAT